MMKTLKKLLPLVLCCGALSLSAQEKQTVQPAPVDAKSVVYNEVMSELGSLKHRIPGSPEFNQAVESLKKIFSRNGIELNVQHYPTLVPEITKKVFNVTIKDKDGKLQTLTPELHPVAPNNASLISTGKDPLKARAVYISKKQLHGGDGYVDYGTIDDKIVLLDWGENYYPKIFFTEGAKAIIFIGDDETTQWEVAKNQSQYNVMFPYFYMTRAEAQKAGLLAALPIDSSKNRCTKCEHIFDVAAVCPKCQADGKDIVNGVTVSDENLPEVELSVHSRWKQIENVNLWAEIKADDPKVMKRNQPEAMILGARLDTFGSVPGLVSGDRSLANLALLAQTAVNLNKDKSALDRSVFVILYGSSFNAYDSLRFFYFPIMNRNAKTPAVSEYKSGFEEEKKDNDAKLAILNSPSPIIPSQNDVSTAKIIMYAGYGLASVLLLLGLAFIAIDIKDQKLTKSSYIGGGILIPSLALFVFFLFFFDVTSGIDHDGLQKEMDVLEQKIADLKGDASKADEYYDTLAKYDDVRRKFYDGVEDKNPVTGEKTFHYAVRLLLREAVIKEYNDLNYQMAEINTDIRHIQEDLEKVAESTKALKSDFAALDKIYLSADEKADLSGNTEAQELVEKLISNAGSGADISEKMKEYVTLLDQKRVIEKDKVRVANMRKLVNERKIKSREDRELLNRFVTIVKTRLEKRQNELDMSINMAADWNNVVDATKNYAIMGSFFFDFATDAAPFTFATRSYEGVHYNDTMNSSNYSKFLETFRKKLPELSVLQNSTAPFFTEAVKNVSAAENISAQSLVYLPHAAALPLKEVTLTMRNIPVQLDGKVAGDGVVTNYDYDEIPGKHRYELANLIAPVSELMMMFATSPEFSMSSQLADPKMLDEQINYYYKEGAPRGQIFSKLSADGKEIDGPAADMIALVKPNEYDRIPPVCGFSTTAMAQINQIGFVTVPMLSQNKGGSWYAGLRIMGGAVGFDEYGMIDHINTQSDYFKLFRAYGGSHVYAYAPLTSNFCGGLSLVNGFTDGKFKNFRTNARVATADGYAYADRDMKAKIYFFNETFILGSTPEDPIGKGISIQPEDLKNLNVSRIAIDNTITLNMGRIDKLHSRNIFNDVIELYHDKAEQHQADAKKVLNEGKINLARAHEVFGQTLAVQAYRPLRDMINDLVQSVLILLILTIPFAFALERLIIGSTNIYKQMAWVLIFFIMTFLLLYFTHPAFALSQAPMIIFIAFFIIVMSVIVIYIVMNRFKAELAALQGMDTASHRVNTQNSMLLAAIIIGVSSMRNRPVKTFLTILTVILLTFTIISFASFESTDSVTANYMGDGSGEPRIESFLPQHVDLLMPICQATKDLYEDNYHVFYRSASYNSPFYNCSTYPVQTNVLYNPNATGEEKTKLLEAVVGFELAERQQSARLARLMPEPAEGAIPEANKKYPGIYLSSVTAEQMNLKVGDCLYLRNIIVCLHGTFIPSELESFTYLDGGLTVPPNFQKTAEAEEKGQFAIFNNAYVDASNFIWSDPNLSVLTDYETANKINGFVNAVVLYPREGKNPDIKKDATDIAEVTFGIVYSNTSEGVNRHFKAPKLSVSGLSDLIVPLLLGALIILSSLLGSIADREREIFTFSALGLSPKDVSMLFFAESGVYAVIGGLGGYLLSQVTNAVLTFCAKRGMLEAPQMNFSSMTTVYTILIVMGIVLLSTVYPAIKAGRAASPDVARKWKMPPPEGDNLSFQFPFTVSRVDFGGILVFISEHFGNHTDSSLGSFAASNIQISHGKTEYTDGYILSVDLTLAPFDLGVAEELKMYSAPSDIEGVDVVTVSIIRKDGSKGAWLRGNRRFVDEVRNQFLLWRSLPVETVMHYRELAAAKLNTATASDKEGAKA